MVNKCCIVGAGEFCTELFLKNKYAYIIAADGGYNYLQKCGIIPNYLIGDFDSIDGIPTNIEVERFPVKKDFTDMSLAVDKAVSLGYNHIDIYGGLGGRLDHTMANISLLKNAVKKVITIRLIGTEQIVEIICNSSRQFSKAYKGIISVFSFDTISYGVTIKGLMYELDNGTLTNDYALGVSNEFIGQESFIEVTEGTLLIIYGTEENGE